MATPVRPLARAEHDLTRDERAAETDRLARLAHETEDPEERRAVLERLIALNIRVARAVAARYRGRGAPLEDLEQVACEGLTKAVHRFDPTLRHDLLSYAVPTIRGEVLRYFRDRSWMVHPPRRVQDLQWRLAAVRDHLTLELGRPPAVGEVCEELGITRAEHDEALQAYGCFDPTSLDQPLDDVVGSTLGDVVADDVDPFGSVEARVTLGPLLRRLDERERRILHMRFVEEQTQREIGEVLGVAQMQVSRWLSRILSRLRSELEGAPEAATTRR